MAIVQALSDISPASLESFSKRLPERIEDALDFPTVGEVAKAAGEGTIKAYLEFELIKLSALVSVGGNLNNSQVEFIASELIKAFPNESIADFKLCFQRGAIGVYGDIFRLDGIVIRGWMQKYLDEKYQIIEDNLMKEKENLYEPIPQTLTDEVKKQKDKERLQNWLEEINKTAVAKTVRPITDADIQKEGRLRIQPEAYKPDKVAQIKILIQGEMHKVAMEGYAHLTAYQKADFQVRKVGDYSVNCDSQEDAEIIYQEAKQRIESRYDLS